MCPFSEYTGHEQALDADGLVQTLVALVNAGVPLMTPTPSPELAAVLSAPIPQVLASVGALVAAGSPTPVGVREYQAGPRYVHPVAEGGPDTAAMPLARRDVGVVYEQIPGGTEQLPRLGQAEPWYEQYAMAGMVAAVTVYAHLTTRVSDVASARQVERAVTRQIDRIVRAVPRVPIPKPQTGTPGIGYTTPDIVTKITKGKGKYPTVPFGDEFFSALEPETEPSTANFWY